MGFSGFIPGLPARRGLCARTRTLTRTLSLRLHSILTASVRTGSAQTAMQTCSAQAVLLRGTPVVSSKGRTAPCRRLVRTTRAVAEPARQAVPFLSDADHLKEWKRESWRNYTALQQPEYPDKVGRGLAPGMQRRLASGQPGLEPRQSFCQGTCTVPVRRLCT